MTEKTREAITGMAWRHSPEAVHYIEQMDGEGYKVQEIDGSYCHACAAEKARQLDSEHGGRLVHQVHEETMPENDGITYCHECGCLLSAAMLFNGSSDEEDELNDIAARLRRARQWSDITGDVAWRFNEFLNYESAAREAFPRQMNYIGRRLDRLYRKHVEQQKPKEAAV